METNQSLRTTRGVLARDGQNTFNMLPRRQNTRTCLKRMPAPHRRYPPLNSVFVIFNQQIAAPLLTHHMPHRISAQDVSVSPNNVIWSNLNMNPHEAEIRTAISWVIMIRLIIVWALPGMFSCVSVGGSWWLTHLSPQWCTLMWCRTCTHCVLPTVGCTGCASCRTSL